MNPLKAVSIARNLACQDQDGEANLTDFRDSVVLVWLLSKAMTPGCTVQACTRERALWMS